MLSRGLCIPPVRWRDEKMVLKVSHFICGHMGIPQIPPLRSLSHIKRRVLRGSESAAKGGFPKVAPPLRWLIVYLCKVPVIVEGYRKKKLHSLKIND